MTPLMLALAMGVATHGMRWAAYFAIAAVASYGVQEYGPRNMFTVGFLRDVTLGLRDLSLLCVKVAGISVFTGLAILASTIGVEYFH